MGGAGKVSKKYRNTNYVQGVAWVRYRHTVRPMHHARTIRKTVRHARTRATTEGGPSTTMHNARTTRKTVRHAGTRATAGVPKGGPQEGGKLLVSTLSQCCLFSCSGAKENP